MALKLSIGNLAALERLIGGDNEVEVEIRQAVVECFAKKHLKAVANSEVVKRIENDIRTCLKDSFKNIGYRSIDLGDSYKESIENAVSKEINYQINLEIKKQVQVFLTEEYISKKIKEYGDRLIYEMVKKEISDSIKEVLDK